MCILRDHKVPLGLQVLEERLVKMEQEVLQVNEDLLEQVDKRCVCI